MKPSDPDSPQATPRDASCTDLPLRDTPSLLRAIVENANSVIFLKDAAGRYVLVNARFEEAFQLRADEIVGRNDLQLFPAEIAAAFRANDLEVMRAGRAIEFEEEAQYGDGKHTSIVVKFPWHLADGTLGGVGGIAVDITERKRAEEERRAIEAKMLQAQKLESLGVLTGGIAHDFNNLLAAILGNAEMALRRMHEGARERAYVETIEVVALRAAELVRQMLAYAGKTRVASERVGLSDLVEEMASILGSVVSKKAIIRTELAHDLPAIQADAAQLRQVVMNLLMNASEALSGNGTIVVRTGSIEARAEDLTSTFLAIEPPPGHYVFLEVVDTGSGMDAETLSRVFDPFFTTKFTGRGLGLAAVLGIVKAHRGTIRVTSTPGRGTTFRVLFPALPSSREIPNERVAESDRWKGHGTVLVIDDEPDVRNVAQALLEAAGYAVSSAADGAEALAIVRARHAEIDAILLDVTMPGLGGEELLARVREIAPSMIVVVMSGHDVSEVEKQFAGQRFDAFVPKPFGAAQLLDCFSHILRNAHAAD